MKLATIRQIEEISLNAWPARQTQFYDGWLLRLSDGYTKRANSVMPFYRSKLPLDEKIDFCEEMFDRAGLPPIFRLTPLADAALDLELAGCGYEKIDPSRVMILSLPGLSPAPNDDRSPRTLPLDQWMGVFSEIDGSLLKKQSAHVQILRNILSPHHTAAIEIDGQWAACGLGVLERGWLGLFDILTRTHLRRQGLATRLIDSLLDWGQAHGARQTYLQVTENNTAARQLYAKLGFEEAYGYWYRVRSGD